MIPRLNKSLLKKLQWLRLNVLLLRKLRLKLLLLKKKLIDWLLNKLPKKKKTGLKPSD